MNGSLNKVILIGNVGGEPQIRKMNNSDKEVAIFSVATNEKWNSKTSEEVKITEWHKIVVFATGLIKVVKEYVKKGTKIYIEGKIRTREYKSQKETRYITEILITQYNGNIIVIGTRENITNKKNIEEEINKKDKIKIEEDIPF